MLSRPELPDSTPDTVRDSITLINPTLRLSSALEACADEYRAGGDARYETAARDVAAFVRLCQDHAAGLNLPDGWVPQSMFWLVRDDECILGCSRIRHALTPFLSHEGGHIGFDIRPTERGRGFGTLLLRLTLEKARELGLEEVLITADEANVASWKVIERNGGRREEGQFSGTRGPFRRYWISAP